MVLTYTSGMEKDEKVVCKHQMMSNKMSWTKAQPHSEVVSRFHKVRGNIRFFIMLLFIHLSLFDSNLTDLHTQNFFDDRSHVVVLVLC